MERFVSKIQMLVQEDDLLLISVIDRPNTLLAEVEFLVELKPLRLNLDMG